jgi:hypothetical protein
MILPLGSKQPPDPLKPEPIPVQVKVDGLKDMNLPVVRSGIIITFPLGSKTPPEKNPRERLTLIFENDAGYVGLYIPIFEE